MLLTKVSTFIKWGASFWWSSSLYCLMQNSVQITIGRTHPALLVISESLFICPKNPFDFYKPIPWFTIWTMFTKPSGIPGTFFYFWIRVNMKILAVTILTATKFWKEITFRHFGHVIFMKKFAIVSFFTQATKPMFTNYTIKWCWKVLPIRLPIGEISEDSLRTIMSSEPAIIWIGFNR